jgi:parallel beta-helix repeat protein
MDKTEVPNCIVFYRNEVTGNNSSGIYSDSGYCNYYLENVLSNNDKEGICLDFGAFGNYLSENIIDGNGGRLRQTDADLEADYVLSYGRMEDGGSKAKLPGVSLDNAAYNILLKNTVRDNYGSGIKTVRSAYRNIIMENSIMDNNLGVNDIFHFFGIEMGFAEEPDMEVIGMDFTPDYENIICNNMIVGEHYAGIFLQEGTYGNDIYNNCVVSQGDWALEDHSKTTNNIHDNVTIGENLTVTDDE